MSVTKESILKAILLKEFDRMQPEMSTFEDDPMQFILRKYEGLNKTLTYLMTPSFQDYITGIYIVAPKPTTFKIVLHNGQFFFLQFTGKTYQATVAGKNYYLMNIGEKERCMLAISRILRFGNPLKTKGPEGAEQGTREGGEAESTGGEAGAEVPEATPEEGGGEEETIAESRILEEVLKKKIIEKEESKEDFSSSEDFEKFVNQKYLGPAQKISGLDFLYDKISSSDNSAKLFSLIKNSGNKTIKPGEYEITDSTEKELFEFTKVVSIPNGNFSELWFAIVYNGKVVGGTKSEEAGDAVSDIIVDSKKISLKNYSSSGTIDLGTLQSDTSKAFNKLLNFLSIVTNTDIDSTIPVSSLNNILKSISNEDVKEFLDAAKDSEIKYIKNLYNYIKNNNLESIKEKFITDLNSVVIDKINKVDYWIGIILDKIYIKSSKDLSKLLQSSNDKISTGISSLKGNHLFVNGNVVFLGKQKGVRESSSTPIKINKKNYKSAKSPTTNEKISYVDKSWIKTHPEYKNDFDYNKTHPMSKDFIMLKPDSKINFDIVDSNLPKKED